MLVKSEKEGSRDLFNELEEREGYEVETYTSADEALQALEKREYKAVLYSDSIEDSAGEEFQSEIGDKYDNLPFFAYLGENSESVSAKVTEEMLEEVIGDYKQNNMTETSRQILEGVYNSPVGVTVAQTKNEKGERPLIYVNNAFEELTGYKDSEVLGKDCKILQGENTNPETIEEIRKALENQEPVDTTILNYTKDEEKLWNQLRISPILNEEGEAELFFGYQVDVTDEVKYRENLELILDIVSHDFRNDLNVIEGNLELLKRNKSIEPKTDVIEERIKSMSKALDNITTIKNGMQNPENQDLVLNDKINSIVESYIDEAEMKGFEFDINEPDEDYLIEGSIFMDQYFGNIFENSIEHSNGDRIEIGYEANENKTTVTVKDNGEGMNTDTRNWGTGMFLINEIADYSNIDLEIEGEDGMTFKSTFNRKK